MAFCLSSVEITALPRHGSQAADTVHVSPVLKRLHFMACPQSEKECSQRCHTHLQTALNDLVHLLSPNFYQSTVHLVLVSPEGGGGGGRRVAGDSHI